MSASSKISFAKPGCKVEAGRVSVINKTTDLELKVMYFAEEKFSNGKEIHLGLSNGMKGIFLPVPKQGFSWLVCSAGGFTMPKLVSSATRLITFKSLMSAGSDIRTVDGKAQQELFRVEEIAPKAKFSIWSSAERLARSTV